MDRTAIFVDAGYLFAQGSVALVGLKQPRGSIVLNEQVVLRELEAIASSCEPTTSLLRTYWYDGLIGLRETAQQTRLAESHNVKLRLGTVNSAGDQKGVDSLIVTDLVDLARAQAVCAAVVLAGDEDVRIGVEIAQRYGVRVHLLGIVPSRGTQSRRLLREADTTFEWDATTIATFLAVPNPVLATSVRQTESPSAALGSDPAIVAVFTQVAMVVAAKLGASDVPGIVSGWDARAGLDHVVDGRLLAQARASLGRDLEMDEKRCARRIFVDHLRTMLP
ncbi:MAG TPA: NYN domain-containing protein [Candidatus Elarobacter sp.]|nr:NYN domain-containing protein [Candidatus Elarobacter sp.]